MIKVLFELHSSIQQNVTKMFLFKCSDLRYVSRRGWNCLTKSKEIDIKENILKVWDKYQQSGWRGKRYEVTIPEIAHT